MDPKVTLKNLIEASDIYEAYDACDALYQWIASGGPQPMPEVELEHQAVLLPGLNDTSAIMHASHLGMLCATLAHSGRRAHLLSALEEIMDNLMCNALVEYIETGERIDVG